MVAQPVPGRALDWRAVTSLDPQPELEAADAAETGRLRASLERLLPSLERFGRFEGQDRAARDRAVWQAALERPLPKEGAGLDRLLEELSEVVVPYGERIGAPGFSGWVVNAPTTAGIAASLAANVAGSQRWSVQSFNYLEELGLRWLAELLGLPATWQGVFVSGGSVANLIGLGAARQHAYEQLGIDPARDGIAGAPVLRIYGCEEVHHCVLRAAGVLGIGRRNVVSLPPAPDGRADVAALRAAIEADRRLGVLPLAVVASAGTVNTGVIDPISELADLAEEHGTWLHVDGAYGLWGRLDERVADQYAGLERAASTAVDPHKWLATPVGVGAAFVRDRGVLGRAFTQEPAAYIEGAAHDDVDAVSPFDSLGIPFHDYTIELSAPSRGALVWAALREIGAAGMRDRVVRHNTFARRLAALVEADERLELALPPTLSICCFRYVAPGLDGPALDVLNARIAAALRADGQVIPSTTTVGGRYVIRPCFLNPRSVASDVDLLAGEVRRHGDALSRSGYSASSRLVQ
jgi:aromatic-L-amino-acid decarboxylase